MSVYVDILMARGSWYPRGSRYRYSHSCHLCADTLEELHGFAESIGMKKSWFQNKPELPHYDLTKTKRKMAVSRGAVEITGRQIVNMMQRNRLKLKEV